MVSELQLLRPPRLNPMKNLIATFLFAATTFAGAHGQTLHIAPMYVGGIATFEVQDGLARLEL